MGFEDKGIFCWFCSLLQSQLRTQEETDRERKGRMEEINNETTYCQGQSKLYNRLSHRDSLFRSCPSFINFFLSYSQKRNTIVIITSEIPLFAEHPPFFFFFFFSSLSLLSFSFLATERGSPIEIGREAINI